ncbi:hypothetical protein ORV05_16365 [Amycolatopsis cynarae]|uniref:DUF1570 domain-containing protein n=1 Tax=Amycolatopsis cynarae TaxID=2995223 RepID=A0ABY7BA77_9PSEU|nr:hypothetical protein [Amycolatopsis sp. HUAS 11-8]WAL69272.1 hypothetical protein ORV05_16365 [Amycolatopsis sp. HUAS 11-8]
MPAVADRSAGPAAASGRPGRPGARRARSTLTGGAPLVLPTAEGQLRTWLLSQATNVERHLAALRPFRWSEFGDPATGPSRAHLIAVNETMATLRRPLLAATRQVRATAEAAAERPAPQRLEAMLAAKTRAQHWVRATERVWDFYLELFNQRQGAFAPWLVACDRIALDCYQYAYLGLGRWRPVPTPPPFCYLDTGAGPATSRRGIPLRRLANRINPFPLIQLPYHRLVNPWTLGAVLHEVSHNLQNDLGLARAVPLQVAARLTEAGLPRRVVSVWVRWNRETFADLAGLLLGGPQVVGSLFDVIGRTARESTAFSPGAVHPVPYLRAKLSLELLRRMGFSEHTRAYADLWRRLYPRADLAGAPPALAATAGTAIPLVVDAMCFTSFPSLGHRALARVLRFEPKEQAMIEEAAERLARGVAPGVVPERFLIGAVRFALERRMAPPERLARYFREELGRRSR